MQVGFLGRVAKVVTGVQDWPSGASQHLLKSGLVGRGVITALQQTNVRVGAPRYALNYRVVCNATLEVTLPGRPTYSVEAKPEIPVQHLNETGPGTAVVVRVDPDDEHKVTIDYSLTAITPAEQPTVTTNFTQTGGGATFSAATMIDLRPKAEPERGSAAEVLATGSSVRAVLLQWAPYPAKSSDGDDVYLLALSVTAGGSAAYGVRVGNPVPPEAMRLLTPMRDLPAKRVDAAPEKVVVDWAAAEAESPA